MIDSVITMCIYSIHTLTPTTIKNCTAKYQVSRYCTCSFFPNQMIHGAQESRRTTDSRFICAYDGSTNDGNGCRFSICVWFTCQSWMDNNGCIWSIISNLCVHWILFTGGNHVNQGCLPVMGQFMFSIFGFMVSNPMTKKRTINTCFLPTTIPSTILFFKVIATFDHPHTAQGLFLHRRQ